MLQQKQEGKSCYLLAVCNALEIPIDRRLEQAYNSYFAQGRSADGVLLIQLIARSNALHSFKGWLPGDDILKTMPATGRGVIVFRHSNGTHAVAYDEGMLCDSNFPEKVFYGWEDYTERSVWMNMRILEVIPLN